MKRSSKELKPDKIGSYFRTERLTLTFVTLSGLLYNVGLSATPLFEGRLVQCLADILGGSETFGAMATLVVCYIAVIFAVQAARFIKRFYVRRFAQRQQADERGALCQSR